MDFFLHRETCIGLRVCKLSMHFEHKLHLFANVNRKRTLRRECVLVLSSSCILLVLLFNTNMHIFLCIVDTPLATRMGVGWNQILQCKLF